MGPVGVVTALGKGVEGLGGITPPPLPKRAPPLLFPNGLNNIAHYVWNVGDAPMPLTPPRPEAIAPPPPIGCGCRRHFRTGVVGPWSDAKLPPPPPVQVAPGPVWLNLDP